MSTFDALQLHFIMQSCFIFTFFNVIAFYIGFLFFPRDGSHSDFLGFRAVFLGALFVMYFLTIFISIRIPNSPLSYELVPAIGVILVTFLGIVGISWSIVEYFPILIHMLNNSISFTLMLFMSGGKLITKLNSIFSNLFEYKQTATNITEVTSSEFPFYFLIHYLYYGYDKDAEQKIKIESDLSTYGITPKSSGDNVYKEAKEETDNILAQMYWISYFIVMNFSLNTALVIAFIVMLLDSTPKS